MVMIKLQGTNPRFPVWINPDHIVRMHVAHTQNMRTGNMDRGTDVIMSGDGIRRNVVETPEEILELIKQMWNDPWVK